uniref:Uncharacterized protein n=1 Tax=Panagrolaimus superbus TaxID=310955 RepID=A0A914YIH1_9BILA
MVMKDENGNNNQLTTVIPAIDFNEASFTFEEYLIHNLEYELKNSKNSTSTFDNITQLLLTYINDPQQVAIFTDDYSYLENLNSLALPKDNRTINYILYLTSENQTIKERIERKFYQDEKIDKFKSFFYIMTPPKNGDDFGEHVCTRVTKAIPVGLLWWHWTLIGIGIFVLVIILVIFYNKCIRQKDPYATVMGNFPP